MSWARLYRLLTHQQWLKVIWLDEAYIYLGDDWGHIFITWHADEKFFDECLVPTFKQSPIHVMVWACIMEGRKGPLVVLEYPGGKGSGMNTKRYCEQVLDGVLKGFYGKMKQEHGRVHFQQDNVLCHTSRQMRKWFDDKGILLFYHPPNSPNLSPIEPVWH